MPDSLHLFTLPPWLLQPFEMFKLVKGFHFLLKDAATENHSVIYNEEYGLDVAVFWFFKKIWTLSLYKISQFTNTV